MVHVTRRWSGTTAMDNALVTALSINGTPVTAAAAVAQIAVHNATGVTLALGALVYFNGWNAAAGKFTVALADADAVGKHAVGVITAAILDGADGFILQMMELTGQNTNAGNAGDPVYLDTTPGAYTLTAPSTANATQQVVGFISVKNSSTGKIRFNLVGGGISVAGSNELEPGSVLESKLDPAVNLGLGALRVCHSVYDFATDAGAIGTLPLRGGTIPDKAVVYGGLLNVNTAVLGAGASVAIQYNAANDIVNAAAISGAPWSTTGIKAIIPVWTAAAAVKGTAARTPSAVISGGSGLTAGHFNLWLVYFVADAAS